MFAGKHYRHFISIESAFKESSKSLEGACSWIGQVHWTVHTPSPKPFSEELCIPVKQFLHSSCFFFHYQTQPQARRFFLVSPFLCLQSVFCLISILECSLQLVFHLIESETKNPNSIFLQQSFFSDIKFLQTSQLLSIYPSGFIYLP